MNKNVTIVYDGDCIYCNNLVRMSKLKKSVGKVDLVNARDTEHPIVASLSKNYVLDEGMMVIIDGQEFYGYKAMQILSILEKDSLLTTVLIYFFRFESFTRLIYPVLKLGRAVTLKLLGRRRMEY